MACLPQPWIVVEASGELLEEIYRARHQIYALEIGQHPANPAGRLTDALDGSNCFLAVTRGGVLAGFVSITPPGDHGYSIDKYFARSDLPFAIDAHTYEVRLLTVMPMLRNSDVAAILMVAALRWIEARGGTRIIAIGRREVKKMYLRAGLGETGMSVKSGAVTYELMHAGVDAIRTVLDESDLLSRIERRVDWRLRVALRKPAACFHGGAFFDAIGADFARLERCRSVINADVLDAWFPPAPRVVEVIREHLPWLLKTSPPTACQGLVEAISIARGVPASHVLPGAGSSDLMFRALPRWLSRESRVIILDPTYGEYVHILEGVIGCQVERLPLARAKGYAVDLERLKALIATGPDLVVLVNPNSPTGAGLDAGCVTELVAGALPKTLFWIDETYIDYTGESVERLVSSHENLVVCKSMSKAYALSGARVAYLCAGPHLLEGLRAVTPPWVVSLPAQVAAVTALQETSYYASRWKQTHQLRATLAAELRRMGWETFPGSANFIFAHLPDDGPTARELVIACRRQGLFLRDAAAMGSNLGERAIRIAVKDAKTNVEMTEILSASLVEI